MRKIDKDKAKILSRAYLKWVEELDRDKKKHPRGRKYYVDVLMNLLHCQKGVCAYTEFFLCQPALTGPANWKNGRYQQDREQGSPERLGEIDHFDPKLKKDRYWEWDNLFVVLERINRLKKEKTVHPMFKPDSPGYEPGKYLAYDPVTHRFRPSPDIKDNTLKKQVEQMLKVFNINYALIVYERESYLSRVSAHREANEPITIDRFFTACRMAGLDGEERK